MRARLQAELPTFDDAAVEQLWTECRKRVPDVTAEEVAALFTAKLPVSRVRSIESPNGFLLRAVAQSCTAAAVAAMRQGRGSPPPAPPLLRNDELRSLLEDPSTPLELRQQIAQRLENT